MGKFNPEDWVLVKERIAARLGKGDVVQVEHLDDSTGGYVATIPHSLGRPERIEIRAVDLQNLDHARTPAPTLLYHGTTQERYRRFEESKDVSIFESDSNFGKGVYLTSRGDEAEYWAKRNAAHGNPALVVTFTMQHFKSKLFRVYPPGGSGPASPSPKEREEEDKCRFRNFAPPGGSPFGPGYLMDEYVIPVRTFNDALRRGSHQGGIYEVQAENQGRSKRMRAV